MTFFMTFIKSILFHLRTNILGFSASWTLGKKVKKSATILI